MRYLNIGWHGDPHNAGIDRWWDGFEWTANTRTTPMRSPAPAEARAWIRPHVVEATTLPAACLSLSPTLFVFGLGILYAFSLASPIAYLLLLAFFPTSFIAAIVWAVTDRDSLVARGIPRAASPLWVMLTPLCYLIARSHCLQHRTSRPDQYLPLHVIQLAGFGGLAAIYVASSL